MKTRTVIAIAIPAGIAKAFVTAKVFYILGILVAFLFASAKAHAGESTEGRMGINRGDLSHVGSDARAVNDFMYNLSNNQQFLNGVLAYQRSDVNVGSGQALLDAMRNAAGNQAAYDRGAGSSAGMPSDRVTGSVFSNGGAFGALGGTSSSFGGYGAFGTGASGGTKCALPVSEN